MGVAQDLWHIKYLEYSDSEVFHTDVTNKISL